MAAPAPPTTHTKVFVGNLSYRTRDAGLKEAFTGANLNVISANIISRGNRSMGYGFVEFENEAEAKKAVEAMNKKELDGRDINVEIANPREESAEKAPRAAPSGGFRGGRGARGGRGRGARGGTRGGFIRGRGRGAYGATRGTGAPRGAGAPTRGGRGGRGRGRGAFFAGNFNRTRQGSPSPTTLFVANLPFAMEDAGLFEVFKDLKVKTAHVVKRPNGRSKGFGFVEFENADDQKAALDAVNGKQVDGRELIVKVALSSQDGQAKEAPAAGAAPAAGEAKPEEKTN